MSHSTPPKSKMTARGLVVAPTSLARRRLRPYVRRLFIRERKPAAILQALLVQNIALRAGVTIALELIHRVGGARLVPLPVMLAAAADQREDSRDDQEAVPTNHARHGTMPV